MNIVAINGSTSKPSRTGDVVAILADAVSRPLVAQPDGKPVRPFAKVRKDNRDLVHP